MAVPTIDVRESRVTLKVLRLGPALVAYERTVTEADKESPARHGVCAAGNVDKVLAGVVGLDLPCALTGPALRADLDTKHTDSLSAWFDASNAEAVYRGVAAGEYPASEVVVRDKATGRLLDPEGRETRHCVLCDARRGGFTDRHYRVEEMAAHLLKRGDVDVHYRRPDGRVMLADGVALLSTSVDEALSAGRGSVSFLWRPSAKDWSRMLEVRDAKDEAMAPYRAMFEADLLGLREAGVAVFEDYDGLVPVEPLAPAGP